MSDHVLVWQFQVHADHIAAFEAAYGPSGDWARLFAQADGYLGTELLRDTSTPGRYLTIDRWQTAEAFATFRTAHAAAYAALDAHCEPWTIAETALGSFTRQT